MSASAEIYDSPRVSVLRRILERMRQSEPRFYALGLVLAAAMAPTLFALSVDQRQFLGVNVWEKPLKFELALVIYMLTLAFFAQWLPAGVAGRRRYRIYSTTVVVAIALEMVWIGAAAAIGTASHFNTTPIGTVIYGLMGASAVVLTSASMVMAVQIARNGATGLSPLIKESIVVGLSLVLPLTLVTAGTMSSMGGHWIAGNGTDAGGLFLMGWARSGGDLRVAHFFATHAMHFIPAAGLLSAAFWGGRTKTPLRLFSALYVAFVVFIYAQALSGRPFMPMLG